MRGLSGRFGVSLGPRQCAGPRRSVADSDLNLPRIATSARQGGAVQAIPHPSFQTDGHHRRQGPRYIIARSAPRSAPQRQYMFVPLPARIQPDRRYRLRRSLGITFPFPVQSRRISARPAVRNGRSARTVASSTTRGSHPVREHGQVAHDAALPEAARHEANNTSIAAATSLRSSDHPLLLAVELSAPPSCHEIAGELDGPPGRNPRSQSQRAAHSARTPVQGTSEYNRMRMKTARYARCSDC